MTIFQRSSTPNNRKSVLFILFSFAGVILFALLGLCLGSVKISPSDIGSSLVSGDTESGAYRIFLHVRLPRVLGALLSGSALAVSGAVIQSVLNNPLASPNIIGVNTGAGLFVLLTSAIFPSLPFLLPLSAFAGALLSSLLVLAVAIGSRISRLTLVLTGVAISSIFGAGMNTILILYPDAYVGASNFLVGGLLGLNMKDIAFPAVYIIIGLCFVFIFRKDLNILSLGGDSARSLGMNVKLSRFILISLAALLAGAAVSFAGLLGFVGLIVPHAVRFVIGNDNRFVIPASALCGGAFVIICDLLSRTLFAPYELPVGILMSFIGGPFFILLIIKNRKKSYD